MPLIQHVERKGRQISVSPYSLLQRRQKTYTIQFASRAGIPGALYLPLHYHHGIVFFVEPFLSLLSSICWSFGGWIVPKALQGPVDRTMHAGLLFPARVMLGKEGRDWPHGSRMLETRTWNLTFSLVSCDQMFQKLRCKMLCLL